MNSDILKNKNCLITGATGGLGSELCRMFTKNKCNLFLTSTNNNKLDKLVKELNSYFMDVKIYYKSGYLNKIEDVKKLVKEA